MFNKKMAALLVFTFFAFSGAFCFFDEKKACAASDFEFVEMKFYESGYVSQDASLRKYATAFPKSTTRYVWCQVDLKNLKFGSGDHTHKITWQYYNPDGTLRGEMTSDFPIKSDWYTAWHQHGWGWEEPGGWPLGSYMSRIILDGIEVAKGNFTIYDDLGAKASPGTAVSSKDSSIKFEHLRFFEGEFEPLPELARDYDTAFSKNKARYIYAVVGIKNLFWDIQDQRVTIIYRYYGPDDNLFCEFDHAQNIPAQWEFITFWKSWGWNEPGNWPVGGYRVEVIYNGRKFGEGRFYICEDSPSLL